MRFKRLLLGDFLLNPPKARSAFPVAAKLLPDPPGPVQKPVTEPHVVCLPHQRTHRFAARVDPHVDATVCFDKRKKRSIFWVV